MFTHNAMLARQPAIGMYALLLCSLVACGGGDDTSAPLLSSALGAATPVVAPMVMPGVMPTPSTVTLSARAVGGEGKDKDTLAEMTAPIAQQRVLGSDGHLVLYGPPAMPPIAKRWPDAMPAGRTFHVDSRQGRDDFDGASADRAWRSLGRLAAEVLEPGDRVVLACGSVWRETLTLARSGSAERPIVVSAAEGCSQPPAIDGSVTLPASAWTRVQGPVHQAALDQVPLQLFSNGGLWLPAHHPNRRADVPSYLALAADGNVVSINGQAASTQLTLGEDLALPAGAALSAGTRIRVRTTAYVIDDLAIAAVDGRRITLATPTTYPVKAGWGYLLTGQAWMVDSAGEWYHDSGSGRLLAYALEGSPASALPTQAIVLHTGIDLQDRAHVVIDGLAVRKVGTGAVLRGGQDLVLRNGLFEDIANRGIDAAQTRAVIIESNRIERTGVDAVFAGGIAAPAADGLVVRDNHIRQSGVLMAGENVLSLPRRSYGAILAGGNATVSGNVVIDSAYIGIRVFENSLVQRNVVIGSCSSLDDCGALYTLGAGNRSRFSDNLVLQVRGQPAGKPKSAQAPQAQGIYLDDDADSVVVDGNTVVDADHGLQLHDVAGNRVQRNRLYGNRVAQLWMQETRRRADGRGTTVANLVEDNLFVPVHARSRALRIETLQNSADAFGNFDRNRYFDAVPGRLSSVETARGTLDLDTAQWFTLPGLVQAEAADGAGSASSSDGSAGYAVLSANRMPNGDLVSSLVGWTYWSAAAPAGRLQREACTGSPCLRYVAGGAPSLLSSPNFSLEKGRWYRLSADLASTGDPQVLQLVVRRGGGGGNGYESLSDRAMPLTVDARMQRHGLVFQATDTVRAADALTGDLGARVDVEGLVAGQGLLLARLELVPIAIADSARLSVAIVNAGDAAIDAPCPLSATQATLCGQMVDLADAGAVLGQRTVTWPLRLAPLATVVLRVRDPALIDNDGDGIADFQDRCPGTARWQAVDASGCALGQR